MSAIERPRGPHAEAFTRDGFVIVRGLLDPKLVDDTVRALDRLLAWKLGQEPMAGDHHNITIHARILELAKRDRRALGVVYDAARKVAPFWRLIGDASLLAIAEELLGTNDLGLAFRGAGIRFDLPSEDRWRSEWHQEYHSQISSPRGVVAWFALTEVDASMGPVELMCGSHREGILPVRCTDPMNQRGDYTQTFELDNLEALHGRYETCSFSTQPGDVVFVDFLLLHRSGFNRSEAARSRLTCQVRYFDMADTTAVQHGWIGGWQDGGNFAELHPELVLT